jgi:IS30 family transposase
VDNATDPNPLVPRPIETINVPVSSPTTNQPNLTSCQTDLKAALAHIDRLSRVRAEEAKTIETLKAQNSKLQTLVENLIRKIRICQENPAACKNLEIP